MILNIITACIRPHNLMHVYESILASKGEVDCDIRWWIIIDLATISLTAKNKQQLKDINIRIEKDSLIKAVCIPLYNFIEAPINVALKEIKHGLVCNLDDDNIMHPNYVKGISSAIDGRERIGVVYQQNLGRTKGRTNRRIRSTDYNKIRPGAIDSAQFTISRDLIGSITWASRDPKNQKYFIFSPGNPPPFPPDGDFIQEVYLANPRYFIVIKKTLCYYNYLAPESRNLDFSD